MTQEEKDKLLEEAKRKYPVGTIFIPVHTKEGKNKIQGNYRFESDDSDAIIVDNIALEDIWTGCIYKSGEWAKIISKPEEKSIEKPQFEVGKWYKNLSSGYIAKAIKGSYIENNNFYHGDYICSNKEFHKSNNRSCLGWKNNTIECPLEEIQQYLPDDHPDKIEKPKSLVGRYVKFTNNTEFNGEYYLLTRQESLEVYYGTNINRNIKDCFLPITCFELMPEGFESPVVTVSIKTSSEEVKIQVKKSKTIKI